jgi:carbonic anhydrase
MNTLVTDINKDSNVLVSNTQFICNETCKLKFNYQCANKLLLENMNGLLILNTQTSNNGYIEYNGSSSVSTNDNNYYLTNIYIKSPASIVLQSNSKRRPAQINLVHKIQNENRYVVLVIFVDIRSTPDDMKTLSYKLLSNIGLKIPNRNSQDEVGINQWDIGDLFPEKLDFVTFNQSAQINYVIFKEPVRAPQAFLNNFKLKVISNDVYTRDMAKEIPKIDTNNFFYSREMKGDFSSNSGESNCSAKKREDEKKKKEDEDKTDDKTGKKCFTDDELNKLREDTEKRTKGKCPKSGSGVSSGWRIATIILIILLLLIIAFIVYIVKLIRKVLNVIFRGGELDDIQKKIRESLGWFKNFYPEEEYYNASNIPISQLVDKEKNYNAKSESESESESEDVYYNTHPEDESPGNPAANMASAATNV